MKIEFYIPKDETIPTRMRLKVDNEIDVFYDPLQEIGLGYSFRVYDTSTEHALEIVEEITREFESQSYDHGASWRAISTIVVCKDDFHVEIEVRFRKRDAG